MLPFFSFLCQSHLQHGPNFQIFLTRSSVRLAGLHCETVGVLETGWSPVLAAMLISSTGGIILNRAIAAFDNIALFQPVINGVAGNLGNQTPIHL